MCLDTAGNKLLGGQSSGVGVVAWDDPASKSGPVNDPDWVLDMGPNCRRFAIDGGRLYAACGPSLLIWNDIASVSSTTPPDVTLDMGISNSLRDVAVQHGALVAVNGYPAEVYLWDDASSVTTDRAPDHTLTVGPASTSTCVQSSAILVGAALDASDNLYVLTAESALMRISNATGAAACAATVTSSLDNPQGLTLLE